MTPDIRIIGQGFYTIAAETRRGERFMSKVDGAEDGMAYCDDTRLTQDIANGAVESGLRVDVNGVDYRGVFNE